MGIRVEHQPSPAAFGMAAFAAGLGKARQRQSKYMLDLLQDQQRLQAAGSKYRAGLGGGRVNRQDPFGNQAAAGKWVDPLALEVAAAKAGGNQAAAGKWVDPLALEVAAAKAGGNPQAAVQIMSQRKANARAARLGLPAPHSGVDPVFQPAPTKEEIRRQQELADVADQRAFKKAEDDLEFNRGQAQRIPEIPQHLLNNPEFADQVADLRKLNDAERKLLTDRALANNPETPDKLADIRETRQKLLGTLPLEPDPNAGGWVYDKDKQELVPVAAGQMAQYKLLPDGTPVETVQYKAYKAAEEKRIAEEKAAEKERIAAEKEQANEKKATRKEQDAIVDRMYAAAYPDGLDSFTGKTNSEKLKKALAAREEIREKLFGGGEAGGGAVKAPNLPGQGALDFMGVPTPSGPTTSQPPAAGGGAPVVPAAPAEDRFDPDTGDLIPAPAVPTAPGGPPPVSEAPALAPPSAIAPGAAERRRPQIPEAAGAVAPPPAMSPEEIAERNEEWTARNKEKNRRSELTESQRLKEDKEAALAARTHVPTTGPPLAQQPTGKAAEGMKKRGYEKVHVLDAEGNPTGKSSWKKKPVEVKTDAEYEALESGTEFIDPFGKRRRKE